MARSHQFVSHHRDTMSYAPCQAVHFLVKLYIFLVKLYISLSSCTFSLSSCTLPCQAIDFPCQAVHIKLWYIIYIYGVTL